MKNCSNGKSEKRDFLDYYPAEKSMHFFGKGYCEKCMGKEQYRERKAKKGYLRKLMPIIYVEGSCFEAPLHDHVPSNKRDSDKDRV